MDVADRRSDLLLLLLFFSPFLHFKGLHLEKNPSIVVATRASLVRLHPLHCLFLLFPCSPASSTGFSVFLGFLHSRPLESCFLSLNLMFMPLLFHIYSLIIHIGFFNLRFAASVLYPFPAPSLRIDKRWSLEFRLRY